MTAPRAHARAELGRARNKAAAREAALGKKLQAAEDDLERRRREANLAQSFAADPAARKQSYQALLAARRAWFRAEERHDEAQALCKAYDAVLADLGGAAP